MMMMMMMMMARMNYCCHRAKSGMMPSIHNRALMKRHPDDVCPKADNFSGGIT